MPDKPNWKEFGSASQEGTDHEPVTIYDKRYGKYGESWQGESNLADQGGSKHNPTPFEIKHNPY
jgi:hypothetical protein